MSNLESVQEMCIAGHLMVSAGALLLCNVVQQIDLFIYLLIIFLF